MRRGLAIAIAAAVALGIAFGAYAAAGHKVAVTEKEFKILPTTGPTTAPVTLTAKNGKVTFTVKNTGHLAHEFIVYKTKLAQDKLPVKAAKAVLVTKDIIGQLKNVKPGTTAKLTLTLPKGKYVLLCNLAAHYQAGQHAALTVK